MEQQIGSKLGKEYIKAVYFHAAYLTYMQSTLCKYARLDEAQAASQSYGFSSNQVWMWELDHKESWALKNWCFWTVVLGEDSWESLGLQGDPTSPSERKSILNIHWKDWCWSWNSNTLATWYEELTHLKRPWCWERLKAGGEGNNRGWDGWMASPTQWTWIWVNSGSWWWTGRPGVLQSMGSQRVGHEWVTELNWTETLHATN